jgi:hypothetical protein
MKPKPPASEHQRYVANLRKPGPVRRLTREEIAQIEHERNMALYLQFGRRRPDGR